MVRRRHLLYLLYTSSARPPSSTPFFTALPPPPPSLFYKGCCSHESDKGKHADEPSISHERAPTTLEEFKRLAEEKASQGIVSQTVDKAEDGFMEAVAGDGSLESVKERYKEAGSGGDFRRTGNE